MKLISLNIWCGKIYEPLMNYIKYESHETDIFCFQEVLKSPLDNTSSQGFKSNIFMELERALPEHIGYFSLEQDGCDCSESRDFPISFGKALFIRKSLNVTDVGDFFIYRERNSRINDDNTTFPASLQYAIVNKNGLTYTIAHVHGLWNGRGKTDSSDRLEQSRKIKTFLKRVKGKVILCGDFNLNPETKSLAIIKENLIDLIEKNKITTTRSSLYKKPGKFADYTFVSDDINVAIFEVPTIVISDHLPMKLDFE